MATRTVRLDEAAETTLREIRKTTGLPISEAFKRGLRSLQEQTKREEGQTPYDIYKKLDLGSGGNAIAKSTDTRRGVRRALKKKLGR